MYTKITLTGYVKQSEEDANFAKGITAEALQEVVTSMEEEGLKTFEDDFNMESISLKIEVVEEIK